MTALAEVFKVAVGIWNPWCFSGSYQDSWRNSLCLLHDFVELRESSFQRKFFRFFFFHFNSRRLKFAFCQSASWEFMVWSLPSEARGCGATLRLPLVQSAAKAAPGVSEQEILHSHLSAFQLLFRRPWRLSPTHRYCHQFWTGGLSIFLKANGS